MKAWLVKAFRQLQLLRFLKSISTSYPRADGVELFPSPGSSTVC
jgi:hypothetical protein